MVSKDQAIGGVIFAVCAIVGILYFVTLFFPQWLNFAFGITVTWMNQAQFWVVAIPVFIGFIAIMAIGAWIGWTMATTPSSKPIEELSCEMEEKKEEKKEAAPPAPESTPEPETKPEEQPKEEKKPERRRREAQQ